MKTIMMLTLSLLISIQLLPAAAAAEDPWLDGQQALEKIKDLESDDFLITMQHGIDNFPFSPKKIFNYTCGIPLIGFYDPKQYKFFKNEAIIKLSPIMLCRGTPEQLIQALIAATGADDCENLIHTKNLDFYAIIAAPVWGQDYPHYNMVFHPVVSQWIGNQGDFKIPVNMGLFDLSDGIQTMDIARDNFSAQAVNPHGEHFSPNNAKFKFDNTTPFVTFWSSAYHGDNAIVIFYTIATQHVFSQQLEHLARESFSIEALINNLKQTGDPILIHSADTIERCIGAQESAYDDAAAAAADDGDDYEDDLARALAESLSSSSPPPSSSDNEDELAMSLAASERDSSPQPPSRTEAAKDDAEESAAQAELQQTQELEQALSEAAQAAAQSESDGAAETAQEDDEIPPELRGEGELAEAVRLSAETEQNRLEEQEALFQAELAKALEESQSDS